MNNSHIRFLKGFAGPAMVLTLTLLLDSYWQQILTSLSIPNYPPIAYIMMSAIGIAFWLSLAWLINNVFKGLIEILFEVSSEIKIPRLIKDIISFLLFFTAILIIISSVFNKSITGLLAASSAAGLLLGLAVQNIISDTFSGIALNLDKPFQIDDYIYLHDWNLQKSGKVLEITWRTTRCRSEGTGTLIVPNSNICQMPITNLSKNALSNNEFVVKLEENIATKRALTILDAALKSTKGVLQSPIPNTRVSNFDETGVTYSLTYWMDKKFSAWLIKHNLIVNIMRNLEYADIKLAKTKTIVLDKRLPNFDADRLPDAAFLIEKNALFTHLDIEEKQLLLKNLITHYLPSNTTIFNIGDAPGSMYMIAEGLLEVFINVNDTAELSRIAYLSTGQFFGEMSLMTGMSRTAKIVAETDATLYEIKKDTMQQLLKQRPILAELISATIAERELSNQLYVGSTKTEQDTKNSHSLAHNVFERMKAIFNFGDNTTHEK